jgi:hypothetical protein
VASSQYFIHCESNPEYQYFQMWIQVFLLMLGASFPKIDLILNPIVHV